MTVFCMLFAMASVCQWALFACLLSW